MLWFTGLSGAGKSTLAEALAAELKGEGLDVFELDGDALRAHHEFALGFSREDRDTNIKIAVQMAKEASEAGKIVVASFITPYREQRLMARTELEHFVEIYVKASLECCEGRDVKGYYKQARAGEIENFTGIDDPYEVPLGADLILNTEVESFEDSMGRLLEFLEWEPLLWDMKKAVLAAGAELMSYYSGANNSVAMKEGDSPVSEADLASERVLIEALANYDFALLSEESEDDLARLDSEFVFVMDPLDGTKDFLKKTGDFSVLLGLVREGEAVIGLVYQPSEQRLYWAVKGFGARMRWAEGEVELLNVSDVSEFSEAGIMVSREHLQELEQDLERELGIGRRIARGSAGLKLAAVASGEAEIYINSSDKTFEWDTCAGQLILEEAGGVLVDLEGDDFVYNKKAPRNAKGFVASNAVLHESLLQHLKNLS